MTIGDLDKRYRLVEPIGRTALGEVRRPADESLARSVAIVVPRQELAMDETCRRQVRVDPRASGRSAEHGAPCCFGFGGIERVRPGQPSSICVAL